jgi:hypothetical protein
MAGPCYIGQEDLETRFSALRVLDVFSNDGKNIGTGLSISCKVASRKVESILGSGWGFDQIKTLVQEDEAIWALVCDLAMADGIKTNRPEWNNVDNPPYGKIDKEAKDLLQQYADGILDTRAQDKAGANPNQRAGKTRTFKTLFAPNKDRPVRGGY